MKESNTMIQHTLYIGLNDKDTKHQEVTEAYVISRLDYYLDGYTLIRANGRYKYYTNDIENESTLVVITFDMKDDDIKYIAEQLKVELNQESILVTKQKVNAQFI